MTRMLLTALLTIASVSSAFAQQVTRIDDPPPLSAYCEFGGNGIFTGNVDVLVRPHLSIRAGGMVLPFSDEWVPFSGVFMINRLFGDAGSYVELGAGVMAVGATDSVRTVSRRGLTWTIGWRRQTRRTLFRAGFTPIFAPITHGNIGQLPVGTPVPNRTFLPMFGVSVGRTF